MKKEHQLSKSMSEAEFVNGYWYAAEIKAERGHTRRQAIIAWAELKCLPIPKDYASWKEYQQSKRTGGNQ